MGKNILFVGGIVALSYIGAFFCAYRYFKVSKAAYRLYENAPEWLKVCGPFVVNKSFLERKNNGDDPCKVSGAIVYIDYVQDMDLFE